MAYNRVDNIKVLPTRLWRHEQQPVNTSIALTETKTRILTARKKHSQHSCIALKDQFQLCQAAILIYTAIKQQPCSNVHV